LTPINSSTVYRHIHPQHLEWNFASIIYPRHIHQKYEYFHIG
jgi:hypothetical protein